MLYSLFVEDVPLDRVARFDVRERLDEVLYRPFDPELADRYDDDLAAKKNIAAMSAAGLTGGADDPFLAGGAD